jgi:hypothetical protein
VAITTGAVNTSSDTLPKTGPIAVIVNEVLADANQSFSHGLNLVLILAGCLMAVSGVAAGGLVRRRRDSPTGGL